VTVELGKLTFVPVCDAPELVAEPVRPHLQDGLWVSAIDPGLADTAAFCEHYGITPVGLPVDWPILVDLNVVDQERVIIGSGIRGSKLLAAVAMSPT
jgi:hypothetical protein